MSDDRWPVGFSGLLFSHLSCTQLFCDPMDCSPPGSSVYGISQAKSGLPLPSPGALPDLGIEPTSPASPASAGRFFTTEPPRKPSLVFMENLKGNLNSIGGEDASVRWPVRSSA
ncbi:unnamed protein product [Rangifer tarandus platyrhynchus]|uniref:Uncharacterized protein n=2 Tax=Rangifer tarandus platyrhynchus TaxID=3082113 RepID=A0AC59YNF4_RANTA|nr:unnamed protein product [Rangifer tarandus platyrhynchus]